MKKSLFLLCALPCLLSAQVSKRGTENMSALWLNKLQTKGDVTLRSESIDGLPDSTYTYYSGKLHKAVSIEYNKDGWPTLEKGYTGIDSEAAEVKTEYGYTHEGDFLVQEAIVYLIPYRDGVWHEYSKEITYINANRRPVKNRLYYPRGNGQWELNEVFASVEYNEKGNPVVAIDSVPSVGGEMKAYMRFEVTYDAHDRIAGFHTFTVGTETGWTPYERIAVAYDDLGNRIDTHYEPDESGEWRISFLIETLYDEHGNIISETEKSLGEDGEYFIVWSDTFRHVYLPDVITSVGGVESGGSSVVYPNPADGYVTVSTDEADHALVTLIDISGTVVARRTIERQAVIAVHTLPKGLYLLTVKTAKGTDVHKLIVK